MDALPTKAHSTKLHSFINCISQGGVQHFLTYQVATITSEHEIRKKVKER
jgi:hypothetical protein